MSQEDMEIDEDQMEGIVFGVDVMEGVVEFVDPMEDDNGKLISHDAIKSIVGSRYLTAVADQGDIDSCVAFTISAALGTMVANELGLSSPPEYSKQEMVDCIPIVRGGISFEDGFLYVFENGLYLEEAYPYLGRMGLRCRSDDLLVRPKMSFRNVQFLENPGDILLALHHQPLTAGMYLYKSFVQHRPPKSVEDLLCVYDPGNEPPLKSAKGLPLLHAVLVTGYGNCHGKPYFIVKNWGGPGWGLHGFARVAAHVLFKFGLLAGSKAVWT